MSLPERLAEAVVPESVLRVAQRLTERGHRAFLVGGCVRDILRGIAPKDWDVATSARPEEVQRAFDKVIPTGIQHGTVTVLSRGTQVEVTTFRTEGAYVDGRRPSTVEFRTEVDDDLSRRDFTINAMAFDPVNKLLVDPFGGQRDLEAKLIRCVGDPLARFAEDGLRALRAVRFSCVLGFEVEPPTLAAIGSTLSTFKKISQERIREEFQKLLLSPRPAEGLALLQHSGLLQSFLPEVSELVGFPADAAVDLFSLAKNAVALSPPSLELRLAALVREVAAPRAEAPELGCSPAHARLGAARARIALTRMKFPTKTIEKVSLLVREHALATGASLTDGELRRLVARVSPGNVDDLFALLEAQRRAAGDAPGLTELGVLKDRVANLLAAKPPLDPKGLALHGADIMGVLGAGPGPIVGDATRFLMDLVLETPEVNTTAALSDALRKWAKTRGV